MRTRPAHLRTRATQGSSFGQAAQLIRPTGHRDSTGVWVPDAETALDITLATLPAVTLNEQRRRELTEGGIQLDAGRVFWTATEIRPVSATSAGDIIVYAGERYRLRTVDVWSSDLWEAIGVRQENQ